MAGGHAETSLQRGQAEAKRRMERCSASLITREMQIKATMRYRRTPVRMAITKKSHAGKHVEKREPLCTVSGTGFGVVTMENSMEIPEKTKK